MAAPILVSVTSSSYTENDKSVDTPSISVQAGDILVACVGTEDWSDSDGGAASISGGGLTWTRQGYVQQNEYCWCGIFTATASTTTSFAVTITSNSTRTSHIAAGTVYVFRDSGGVGTGVGTEYGTDGGSGTEPSLNITTSQADSAIVVVCHDWNADDGTSRTWRTGAGTLTEGKYNYTSGAWTSFVGCHEDTGSVKTSAVGLSAPTGMKYSIVALEILGTSSTPALTQHSFRFFNDDGSGSAATAKANINTNINLAANDVARIRMLIDANLDPAGKNFRLEFRHKPSGGSFGPWEKVN